MVSGHGGRRPGAGRKAGTATQKTRDIADRAASEGKTPLEVMLDVMRRASFQQDDALALEAAKSAAPYVHPRLSSIEHGGKDGQPLQLEVVSGVPRAAD